MTPAALAAISIDLMAARSIGQKASPTACMVAAHSVPRRPRSSFDSRNRPGPNSSAARTGSARSQPVQGSPPHQRIGVGVQRSARSRVSLALRSIGHPGSAALWPSPASSPRAPAPALRAAATVAIGSLACDLYRHRLPPPARIGRRHTGMHGSRARIGPRSVNRTGLGRSGRRQVGSRPPVPAPPAAQATVTGAAGVSTETAIPSTVTDWISQALAEPATGPSSPGTSSIRERGQAQLSRSRPGPAPRHRCWPVALACPAVSTAGKSTRSSARPAARRRACTCRPGNRGRDRNNSIASPPAAPMPAPLPLRPPAGPAIGIAAQIRASTMAVWLADGTRRLPRRRTARPQQIDQRLRSPRRIDAMRGKPLDRALLPAAITPPRTSPSIAPSVGVGRVGHHFEGQDRDTVAEVAQHQILEHRQRQPAIGRRRRPLLRPWRSADRPAGSSLPIEAKVPHLEVARRAAEQFAVGPDPPDRRRLATTAPPRNSPNRST